MRRLAIVLALPAALSACVTQRASLTAGPLQEVRREENPLAGRPRFQAVRRTEISPEARLGRYRSIRVEPFGIENFKGGGLSPKEALGFVERAVREALAGEGCFEAVVGPGETGPEPMLVLRGAVVELYPGGRVALDAEGTASEAARAGLAVVVSDAATGAALQTIRDSSRRGEPATSGLNPTGLHSERSQRSALRDLARRAAGEIAEAARAGRDKK